MRVTQALLVAESRGSPDLSAPRVRYSSMRRAGVVGRMSRWWIDQPALMGSDNPTDGDLAELAAEGLTLVVSLLDESEQPPRYDPQRLAQLEVKRVNIPVEDFHAPSLAQLADFVDLVETERQAGSIVVHCQGGTGRTGTVAAAYWIAKGVPYAEAVAKVRRVRPGAVETDEQRSALQAFEAERRGTTTSSTQA